MYIWPVLTSFALILYTFFFLRKEGNVRIFFRVINKNKKRIQSQQEHKFDINYEFYDVCVWSLIKNLWRIRTGNRVDEQQRKKTWILWISYYTSIYSSIPTGCCWVTVYFWFLKSSKNASILSKSKSDIEVTDMEIHSPKKPILLASRFNGGQK